MKYLIVLLLFLASCKKDNTLIPKFEKKSYPKDRATLSTEVYFKHGGTVYYNSSNKYLDYKVKPQTLVIIEDTLLLEDYVYFQFIASEGNKVTCQMVSENKQAIVFKKEYADTITSFLTISQILIE